MYDDDDDDDSFYRDLRIYVYYVKPPIDKQIFRYRLKSSKMLHTQKERE